MSAVQRSKSKRFTPVGKPARKAENSGIFSDGNGSQKMDPITISAKLDRQQKASTNRKGEIKYAKPVTITVKA